MVDLATASAADLLTEYAVITSDLAVAYRARATAQVAKLQIEVEAWFNAPDDRLAVRDKMAVHSSLTYATEVFRSDGEIRALEALRDFVLWRLNNLTSPVHVYSLATVAGP